MAEDVINSGKYFYKSIRKRKNIYRKILEKTKLSIRTGVIRCIQHKRLMLVKRIEQERWTANA